jgi:hypothetical protein
MKIALRIAATNAPAEGGMRDAVVSSSGGWHFYSSGFAIATLGSDLYEPLFMGVESGGGCERNK